MALRRREAPEHGPDSHFGLEKTKAQIWLRVEPVINDSRIFSWYNNDSGQARPLWLDSGPQPCLPVRTTVGSLPGQDSQAKTGVGVKGPGHRRFVNCSGAFSDEKNLRTRLQLLSWPSGYFMFLEESYGSITNLTWTFVLRKVSLFTRRVNFSIISIFQISLQAKLCRSNIHSWLRQQKHGIRFHYSMEPPLLPGN